MKKIFYLILLGVMFLIPKNVFAKIYYVGYESTGYLYTSNSSLISEISGNSGEWRYQPNVTTIIDGNGTKSGIFTTKLMNINGINASSSYNLYGSFTISKKNEACSTLPCSSSSSMKSLFDRISYDYKLNGSYTNVKCQISNAQGDGNEVTYDFRCDDVRLNTQSQGFSFYFTPTFFNSLSISSSLTIVEVGNNAALEKGLDDIKQEQEKTNEKLDGINDTMNNDTVDMDGANSFFGDFSDTDHGGISGVVTAPLRFINKLTGTCSPISLDVLGADVELPCGDTLFWNKPEVANFRIIWNVLFGGAMLYLLLSKLFKVIESLKNPDDSRIEVMKL